MRDLNIEETGTLPRPLLLSGAGIYEADCLSSNLQAPLDDLNASNILTGPFKIALTSAPYQHLTFAKLYFTIVALQNINSDRDTSKVDMPIVQNSRK